MELVLRFEKNQLCIDHVDGYVGFVVLTDGGEQFDFGVEIEHWEQLKKFIDDSIWQYQHKKED